MTLMDDTNTISMREQSIAYRVARGINKVLGSPLAIATPFPVQDKEPEPKGVVDTSSVAVYRRQWEEFFTLTSDRRRRYLDYDRMDTGDVETLLDGAIDSCTIADDGRLFGFKIKAGAKIRNLLEGVQQRTNLNTLIRESLRDTLKYGDEFVGITINDNADITALQPLPVDTMLARVDKHNRLRTGTEQYDESSPMLPAAYWQVGDSLRPIHGWYPWEMCHLKYRPTWKNAYSSSCLLEAIRPRWHKLRMMEEAMTIARLVRAYPRLLHYLDVTGKDSEEAQQFLKDYMDIVRKTKLAADTTTGSRQVETKTWGVDEDMFTTTGYIGAPDGTSQEMRTRVELLDPQATGMRHIPDIEYMQRGIFLKVSGESVGIPGDREDVSLQDVASSRFYQWCQRGVLEQQLLRPIFDLALFLKGYKPGEASYELLFPKVIIESSWRFADAGFRKSMEDTYYKEMFAISQKWISQNKYGFTDEQWEEQVKQMLVEREQFGDIDQGTQAQQVKVGNKAT